MNSVGHIPMSDSLDLGLSMRRVGLEETVERLRSPDLKYLSVNTGFSIDDFDFSPLSCHERLEGLGFFQMVGRLSSIDKILRHIKKLDALSITYASPINDDIIRSIASINGLKRFKLWNPVNNMTGVDWSPLGNCESLESIDIEGARLKTIDLTFAGRLKQLARLILNSDNLREIDLAPLSNCEKLVELDLTHNSFATGVSLEPLSHCPSLKTLWLTRTSLTEIDLSPLAGTGLVTLSLSGGRIRTVDLSPLAKCRNLQTVELAVQRFARVDLSPLSDCGSLRSLRVDGNRLSKIDLSPLAGCVNLEILDFSANRLKSIDLSPLSSCTSLRELLLAGNLLRNVDLSPLWACPNIKLVDLRDNLLGQVDKSPVRTGEVRLADPSRYLKTTKGLIKFSTEESETDIPDAVDTIITERDEDEDE